MTEKKPTRTRACTPETLKRMAIRRLKQRLDDDEMTTTELLKVAALKDPDAPDDPVPLGDWQLTLQE